MWSNCWNGIAIKYEWALEEALRTSSIIWFLLGLHSHGAMICEGFAQGISLGNPEVKLQKRRLTLLLLVLSTEL